MKDTRSEPTMGLEAWDPGRDIRSTKKAILILGRLKIKRVGMHVRIYVFECVCVQVPQEYTLSLTTGWT